MHYLLLFRKFPFTLDLLPDIGDDLDYDSSNKGLEIFWMLITKERKMIFPIFSLLRIF
jgi:hypothetical protein